MLGVSTSTDLMSLERGHIADHREGSPCWSARCRPPRMASAFTPSSIAHLHPRSPGRSAGRDDCHNLLVADVLVPHSAEIRVQATISYAATVNARCNPGGTTIFD